MKKKPAKDLTKCFPGGSAGKEYAHYVGDLGSIPGLGRYPGEGNSYPLQYSGLENSMDCIVHGVAESDTTEHLLLQKLKPLNSKALVPFAVKLDDEKNFKNNKRCKR